MKPSLPDDIRPKSTSRATTRQSASPGRKITVARQATGRGKTPAPTHRHQRALIKAGYPVVAGIDEVGRGCWAGPVVAAAVILPPSLKLAGVTDSKLLAAARREQLVRLIKRHALAVGIGWVPACDVDANGLSWAVRQSGIRALKAMNSPYDAVLLDGNHNYLREHCYAEVIIKGDRLSLSIAAASIVAKVARDRYMIGLARRLPGYGFEIHKGYGTPAHRSALAELGPTTHHRRSWVPFRGQPSPAQNEDIAFDS